MLLLAAAAPAQSKVLNFGVYSFAKPTEVYVQFQPAIKALQDSLRTGGAQLSIDVRVFRTYDECLSAFVAGEIDFVRFGPASYVLAKERKPQIELLAIELEGGKKVCQGVIVVRADSPIQKLADLRGRRFAFGDQQSTIGRYLSQAELLGAGLHASDLAGGKPEYLERHDIVFKAVELGDFDAGALHIDTFKQLNAKSKSLRILHTFENVGKPWIARAGLDPAVVQALRTALLSLRDKDALKALKVDGLGAGTDADYEPVRVGMQRAAEYEGQPPADRPGTGSQPIRPSPAPGKRP